MAELLQRRAAESPDRGYTWLAQGEDAAGRLTYAGLDRRARAIAVALAGAVPPGERALLLHPPGLDFVTAFFGCLYAGVIAIPAHPPHSRRPDPRLQGIARDCRPQAVLTTAALLARREALTAQVPELAPALWLGRETLHEDAPDAEWTPRPGQPEDIAFLQYTSGSTGSPKGVVVTHANLLDNLERIRIAFGQAAESIVVGWLPLFHDMGLIGNVLQPCYAGSDCVLMSPAAFLQKPARWLQAIHRFRGTTSGGPNFAYDLCVRSVGPEVREELDLSSWSVAFNGAEPVRAETLRRFAEAFAPSGFRRAAFVPCYGLAEATLLVTAASVGAVRVATAPVSCGRLPGEEVRIVSPERGIPLAEGEMGEIWVSGPSVAAGYWNQPEETRETFGAVLQDGRGPYLRYLRTGDLGFVRDGELFVSGRLKDLIILRGRNLHPQDLELTAEQSHPALRAGGGAAFSVEQQGEDRLVLVHEIGRRLSLQPGELGAIADAVRRAVAEEHGVAVASVALLRAGTIPKTSSGKIRRRECRARYLAGDLEVVYRSADQPAAAGRLLTRFDLLALDPPEREAALTAWLREEVARRAGVAPERLVPEATLGSAGLDSLALFDLQGRLEADLGLALSAAPLSELSIAALRDRLLGHLAEASEPGTADLPPLVAGEALGDHPLSPGQEALWFLEQSVSSEGEEGVLHIAAAARLGTEVDGPALLRTAFALSARHPALRTSFAESQQRVHANLPPDLGEVNATGWSPAELDEALRREARRRFDLAQGPPLRLRLFTRPGGERVLLLVVHHLVGDFWSLAVLLRDWAALYRGKLLPDLPLAYTDFVRWQRRLLEGLAGERLARYWLDRLRGAPLTLDLPLDRPRPRAASYAGALADLRLDPDLAGRVRELARGPLGSQGTTLFTALLAAFQALLGRLTGQDDLLVGCPTTGRRDPDLAGVVGYFVNPVVLRADLAGEQPFSKHLERTRQAVAEALENRDFPFAELARRLQPTRDPAWPPVFQAMFVLQRAAPAQEPDLAGFAVGQAGARVEVEGLVLESLRLDRGTAQIDLTLSAAEVGDTLALSCEHSTALFDGVTIVRWLGHLSRLLEGAVADPQARLRDLPLLSIGETLQLAGWNATVTDYPAVCVHELFARQAERSPDTVAVVFGDRELTYGELDLRSRHLARRLRRLGVTTGSLVGLCAERSPEMVVGMLGILAAGGAYVPLDPTYPEERLAFMLEDAGARVLVAQEILAGQLLVREGLRVEILECAADASEDLSPTAPPLASSSSPDDPAYVIFTSGSTGWPKGVMVPHRAIVRLVRETDYVRLGPDERLAQASNSSFDAATFEIWGALLHGGRLVGIEREVTLDPGDMVEALHRGGVTALFLTTALFNQIARQAPGGFAPLRYLLFGGEMVDPAAVRAVLQNGPPEHLLHVYGPTETTTFAAWHRVESVPPGETVPIGQPLANGTLHVLDQGLHPLPAGVPGELYIGGDGLAHGYHARPELTAERFVPDPLSRTPSAPGARLYRTGDLVRRRPDGPIELLGRLDHQVKIRGFRIEPGEIEAALVALAGVREAAVTVQEGPGERRLVAYVVGDLTVEALRRSLRERLPDHMVPAAFVRLAALPLTPNGKVDRKALPAPEGQSPEEGHRAPRTPAEDVLAGIWAEVLGLERVGANDDFFALGGHSLLATRVMSRLRGAFGVELPLRDLFEASTPAELAARVEAALRDGASRPAPPLVPVPREGPLPLSFAQQRLWLLDQLEPGSPLYNLPAALRIEGPLDARVLALCLGEIVHRHEALRTVFAAPDGEPIQVIQPAGPFALPVVDLSGLPERAREALAVTLAAAEAVRPFDLGDPQGGPLLRCLLLRLAEGDHVALLSLHHIASDGWSLGLLVRELRTLYAAYAAGRPSPLATLPVQYADFAVWQRSWLQGEVLEGEISFWRRQLAGLPPRLELPTDRPRPAVQSFRGATRPVRLPAGLARQLHALSRREGATLFMVLLAGFQALLARTSGQEDLAVGSPVAGRNHVEIEGLIGFFVNTLVLRGDLTGEPSFRDLLARVRETALLAHAHQDLPFERLVEELAPERSLAHTPLFQVVLALQNAPFESLEIEGLRLRRLPGTGTTAKFDLTLSLEEQDGELVGTAEHASDLFDAATIDRLILYYERLLGAALETPERKMAELPLLSRSERHQLLQEWSDTAADFPREETIHGLFAGQAQRRPTAVALEQGDARLTWGELRQRAERLARRLVARGLRPEERVAVVAERSPDLIVALLGILQAGGAYLPLDPTWPPERLRWVIEDAGASRLVPLDGLEGEEPAVVLPQVPAESLAYVMYTSGSTGRPKGVAVTHRNVVRLVRGADYADLGPDQTWLQYAPVSFDASTLEIWAPLLNGGRLVLFPGRSGSLDDLARVVESHGVTAAWLTAGLFHEMVDGRLDGLRPLRQLLAGGDVVSAGHARRALAAHPGLTLIDGYGPTEGTTFTCCHRMTEARQVGDSVPIGRPIANARTCVLDGSLAPVTVGVWGELYAGGEGLARGYLDRPDLTAERFVPDPFAAVSGGRLYRTGDLVRWRTDGILELSGRIDNQVKLRGFRVELGEIEAALVALPGVREAVVVVRASDRSDRSDRSVGSSDDRRLVAYVTGDATAEELRHALRVRLPEPMVPAAFVTLPALPLTPNGKVDRKALPAPEWQRFEGYLPPRTAVEEVLAGIWAEVLGLDRVGANDHFFALGGHSLLATRVMARLRGTFGVEMPLHDLFAAPRLEDFAARIEAALQAGAPPRIPPLVPVPRERALPLSFAQQRFWFLYLLEPESPAFLLGDAVRLTGALAPGALAASLSEIVRRHEVLRTRYLENGENGDGPVQIVDPAAPVPLPLVDLGGLSEEVRERELRRLAEREIARPFDLTREWPLRTRLVRLSREEHAVLFTLHHIAGDGWSLSLLTRDLGALYSAFANGQAGRRPSLPELAVQYADFAVWQRDRLRGERLEAELAWWRDRLAGPLPVLELPQWRDRPETPGFRGAACLVAVPAGLRRSLEEIGHREGATLFMTLLAGFKALLHQYSGQEDLLVGTNVANRDRREVEELIGFFVNNLVLRTDLSGNPGFRELVRRVRDVTQDALAHQEVPFEKVLEAVQPQRQTSFSPIFQVMFVLQSFPPAAWPAGALEIAPLGLGLRTANFDLTLELREEADGLGGLGGALRYDTDLFEEAAMVRMVEHFLALLESVAADPELPLSAIRLAAGPDIRQLASAFNEDF